MPSTGYRIAKPVTSSPGAPRRRTNNRGSVDRTRGSAVAPGAPLSKAEQEARKDSLLNPLGLDGQSEPKNQTMGESFAELATKMRLNSQQLDVFLPGAIPDAVEDEARPPGNLRMIIAAVIAFIIVLGSIHQLVEYLLFATSVFASCTPSTVYIPVTRYASISGSPMPIPAVDKSTTRLTVYSTITEMATMTSYITQHPSVLATGLTSSGGPSYYFTVDSAGSTDWLNGVSPPATASLTVITRSIFVTPVMQSASYSTTTATITSTATIQQTITVPAYTSTTYSFIEPDTTVTSTSTHYVTYTVSRASSTAGDAGTTSPRPSYSGPGTSGWNTSSAVGPIPTGIAAAADAEPQMTTMTEIHYWGEGDMTTSTMTSYITTSIQVAYTTVVTPSIPEPSGNPELTTTITALPVTLTYSGDEGYSTSIAFNTSALSPFASSSRVSSPSLYQTGASITSPLMSSGGSAATPATQGSSSGIFTNSAGPATMSAAGYSPGVSSPLGLSSGASGSIAGPLTGSTSSPTLSASTTVSPGPVLPSTSLNQTGATSSASVQGSSSLASTSMPPASSVPPSGASSSIPVLSSAPVGINATAGSLSASASSNGVSTATSSSSTAPISPSLPLPTYVTPTLQTSSSTAVTAGPAGGSSSSSLSAQSATSSAASSSAASSSFVMPSPNWSTFTRTTSSSLVTAVSVSPATSPNATVTTSPSSPSAISSSSTSSSGSVSLVSYSQTLSPTTESISGIPASAASSMPTTGCGESGDFMLDFDNLPSFTPSNQNQTDITQAPPISNPYHHFSFSDGYVYAPDPKVPYEPISEPHLAVFVGNGTGMRASQAGHTIEDGEFADGPYEASSAFWFDAFSGWFGCDNEGPKVCTLVMSAYTYSSKENDEVLSFQKNDTVEGCPGFKGCKLKKVEFPDTFKGLSGLQVQAFVGQQERMFFLDDVALRWTDNSCAAGLTRQRAR